jgi:hypothetical protein
VPARHAVRTRCTVRLAGIGAFIDLGMEGVTIGRFAGATASGVCTA